MIHRSLPCFQHGQEVGVIILHVLAAQKGQHLVVGQIADDDRDFGQARPPSGFNPVMSEGNLNAIASLATNDAFPEANVVDG